MPQNLSNLTKSQEDPNKKEPITQPEKVEKPAVDIEVEKTVEKEAPLEVADLSEGVVTEEKQEAATPTAPVAVQPSTKSPTAEKIEDILEEDLEDIYFQMPPDKQAEFRKAGEETANNIETLLKDVKVKVKKVLELITKWLKIVPGLNKYFLQQEAKIKADKILELKEQGELPPSQEDKNKI
ncbi:hypothetical protein ACFL2U_03540 [Patescibacteria group bacterium]